MRKTLDFDHSRNKYITKLEKLYNIAPRVFYELMDLLLNHPYPIGRLDFSHKTECVHLPDRETIYPATVTQVLYNLFIVDKQKELLNSESLRKLITLITTEKGFPHLLIITTEQHIQKLHKEIELFLPEKTNEICYTIGLITDKQFDDTYEQFKQAAIKITLDRIKHLI